MRYKFATQIIILAADESLADKVNLLKKGKLWEEASCKVAIIKKNNGYVILDRSNNKKQHKENIKINIYTVGKINEKITGAKPIKGNINHVRIRLFELICFPTINKCRNEGIIKAFALFLRHLCAMASANSFITDKLAEAAEFDDDDASIMDMFIHDAARSSINPASGLPLVSSGIDISGNPIGSDLSFSSDTFSRY